MSYTGSYTIPQQIHVLNFMANAGFGILAKDFPTLQGDVSKVINAALTNNTPAAPGMATIQSLIGNDWTPVWGPYVYSKDATATSVVADNTMMLVYSPSQSLLVLAIAGTNLDSLFDWDSEDFDVSTMVAWTTVVGGSNDIAGTPYISTGTKIGLDNLLNLPNTTGTNMLTALTRFLAQESIPGNLQLIVTGHSLGGALSPAMAMYLDDILDNGTNWDPQGKIHAIAAWPTAGPTPGETDFAAHISSRLGSNYNSYYNSIDAVPHAWEKLTLAEIPFLYIDNLLPNAAMIAITAELELRASKSGHAYTQATPWNKMPGTYNPDVTTQAQASITKLISEHPDLKTALQDAEPLFVYAAQIAYQHTVAYSILLNITDYSAAFAAIKKNLLPDSRTIEEALIDGVVAFILKYISGKLSMAATTAAAGTTAAS